MATPASAPYQSLDPSTGEVLETFDHASDAQIEDALARARIAYGDWRERPRSERVDVVRRVGALFTERAADLAALAAQEMGKPAHEGVEEAEFCTAIFGYFADQADTLLADRELPTEASGRAVVQRVPIGTVLGVMPWNFPYYQVARFVAPNLVLGNTVVLKHAESVPRCALAIADIFHEAGAGDAFVNVFATHDQVTTMIADPRVAGVSLTGSERAGAAVATHAGRALKKCVLELGGSDPFIVLDATDPAALADTAWDYRMYNNGQACNSNKRMLVHADVYEPFVTALVARAESLDAGSLPPLSSRAAAEAVAAQVEDAVAKGATLHAGGLLAASPVARYSPAVLTGVTPQMRAYDEELFGPVAVVYRIETDDEAVALANASAYGLGGSVFSADVERATRVARRLDVGMANVNTPAGEGAELPFGGTKRSGFGRELGPLGINEFANERLLFVADDSSTATDGQAG